MENPDQSNTNRADSIVARNHDQLQSYVMTSARYDFNIYEKRIMYRIVELAQEYTADAYSTRQEKSRVETNLMGDKEVVMPLSSLGLPEDYPRIKAALRRMLGRVIEFEEGDTWTASTIIERLNVNFGRGYVSFRVPPFIWDAILDFSKGYTKYELSAAMSLKSTYSMRFYELISGNSQPLTFTIDYFREHWLLGDKYKQTSDFIKYVVEPSRQELDQKAPYSFTYKYIKDGKKIKALLISPIHLLKNRDPELERQSLMRRGAVSIDSHLRSFLKKTCRFTAKGLNNNGKLWKDLQDTFGSKVLLVVSEQWNIAANKDNPQGYLIASLKGKVWDELQSRTVAATQRRSPYPSQPVIDISFHEAANTSLFDLNDLLNPESIRIIEQLLPQLSKAEIRARIQAFITSCGIRGRSYDERGKAVSELYNYIKEGTKR